MKKIIGIISALGMLLTTGFVYATDYCGGNQCFDSFAEAIGGGYSVGAGEGYGFGENDGSGPVVDRGSLAKSETGFIGTFAFNADTCGDCGENQVTVGGEGFSSQYGASFIQTNGPAAFAGSRAEGGILGESGAFSGFRK